MLAYTINGMLGGRIAPRLLDDDSTAAASPRGYPDCIIAGIVMLPVPAAFATADPEKLAKIRLATSSTIPMPPLRCPTSV
jgi:hypothetical protein